MSVWFGGDGGIDYDISQVNRALEYHGTPNIGVVGLMPGLTKVELGEKGPDSVTIRANEGLTNRTNISKRVETEHLTVEFDEKCEAGSKVTATARFLLSNFDLDWRSP